MNNKIKNEMTKIPSTTEMNDKDRLNDVLLTLKSLTNAYSIALNEASNDNLYNDYIKLFKDIQDLQREAFNLAFSHGWYALEEAEEQKIEEKLNEYKNFKEEL